jgi:hypothetical protein
MTANALRETAPASPTIDTQTDITVKRMPRIDITTPQPAPHTKLNPMYDLLVQSETDVTGLLAYALYKQNKRDWLITFHEQSGREPTASEIESFITGERIPRRIATYRRLADDMLLREPPQQPAGLLNGLLAAPANDDGRASTQPVKPTARVTMRYIFIMLALLVAMAIVFRTAAAWLFS